MFMRHIIVAASIKRTFMEYPRWQLVDYRSAAQGTRRIHLVHAHPLPLIAIPVSTPDEWDV
jgi:hypothetical protein